MILIIKVIFATLIIGLFLFSKLLPHKDKLDYRYKTLFDFFYNIFTPVLNGLKSFIQPFEVGQGLSIDMTQVVLVVLLLIFYGLLG